VSVDPADARRPLDRRAFVSRAGLLAAASLVRSVPPGASDAADAAHAALAAELHEITLSDLAQGLSTGRWTSRGIVEWYLAEIERVDRDGPALNAILELNPDALTIADALDAERAAKGPRGPLHGIPILVKDNIGTRDRMHTSAGSLALAESIAPRDAFVVERLRAAGCVILGKSNMSEWAAARGRGTIGGWSGRGHLTRNPYALDRSAGGSSSGTAAAVSANLAPAALGTETVGSIVSPSAICGIVGLKPTVGLVSRAGTIPTSITQDTVGPMTRTVRDAAIILSAIAGHDPRDPATAEARRHAEDDYTKFLDAGALRGARIGVARNLFGASRLGDRVIGLALDAMRAAGAVLVDPADVDSAEAVWSFDAEVLSYELKAGLDAYLGSLPASSPIRSLKDVIAFNARNADREMAWFGQETFEYADSRGPLTSPEYQRALLLVRSLARAQGIDATIQEHKLDAIVAPTDSPAWLIDPLLGDNSVQGAFVVAAAAGYPSLTVPAGDVAGLPVGLLFMGPAWSEGTLLRLGYAFEQRLRARRAPTFQPTIRVRP
jgi:amidase